MRYALILVGALAALALLGAWMVNFIEWFRLIGSVYVGEFIARLIGMFVLPVGAGYWTFR